jgi:hypothetical protein
MRQIGVCTALDLLCVSCSLVLGKLPADGRLPAPAWSRCQGPGLHRSYSFRAGKLGSEAARGSSFICLPLAHPQCHGTASAQSPGSRRSSAPGPHDRAGYWPTHRFIFIVIPDACIGDKGHPSDLGIDQIDLVSTSCGGALACPACLQRGAPPPFDCS